MIALTSACSGVHRIVDLHRVHWLDVSLPGSVCGSSDQIHLKSGDAVVRSTRWPQWPRVHVTDHWIEHPVAYGTLGHDRAAAVSVNCNNGGGTVDGVLAYAQVIFVAAPTGVVRLVGVITARVQRRDQLATVVEAAFRDSDIVAREFFYGSADGSCCPSGRAKTIWAYKNGRLSPIHTVVTKQPYHFPP